MNEQEFQTEIEGGIQELTHAMSEVSDGKRSIVVVGASSTLLRMALDDLHDPRLTEGIAHMLLDQAAAMRGAAPAPTTVQ